MMEPRELRRIAIARFGGGALVLGAVFFLPAGTLRYWQAWVYIAVIFIPMILALRYLLAHDPALLERRLAAREARAKQSAIQKLGSVFWLALFLIPGFDQRFGWSAVPWPLVVFSDLMVLGGYLLFFRVLLENSYASRTIQVHDGQTVITTGPYAVVRHPMYSAVLTMLVFSPLALGSFWALIPALLAPLVVVARIQDEEEMMLAELPGYRAYTQQTPHRLIPGVW
jgi:protein-S-isoprenylcysteine O-methyltransferase Ste14